MASPPPAADFFLSPPHKALASPETSAPRDGRLETGLRVPVLKSWSEARERLTQLSSGNLDGAKHTEPPSLLFGKGPSSDLNNLSCYLLTYLFICLFPSQAPGHNKAKSSGRLASGSWRPTNVARMCVRQCLLGSTADSSLKSNLIISLTTLFYSVIEY